MRRLRRLVSRLYNVHAHGAAAARRAAARAAAVGGAAGAGGAEAQLELLGELGSHRTTTPEASSSSALRAALGGGGSHASTSGCSSPMVRRRSTRASGPPPPRHAFDFDGSGAGLALPGGLAAELSAKGAFALGCWLRLEEGSHEGGLLYSLLDTRAETGVEVTMQPSAQQLLVSVYCERKEKGGGGGALGGGLRLLKGAAAPERVSLGGFSLQPGRWHHLLLCFRKGKLLGGKSEALAYVDGARAQATHCAYPQLLPDAASSSAADAGGERDSAAAARLSFRVGAFDERRGFQGSSARSSCCAASQMTARRRRSSEQHAVRRAGGGARDGELGRCSRPRRRWSPRTIPRWPTAASLGRSLAARRAPPRCRRARRRASACYGLSRQPPPARCHSSL